MPHRVYIFYAASTSGCVCPGDTLTYECTVMGFGATIWTGSALHCLNSGNALTLLHTLFLYNGSSRLKYCNKGAIVARMLSVEGNNYTSQLNVTVTPDTAGKIIECGSDNGTQYKRLFTWTIPTITGLSCAYSKPVSCLYFIIDTHHNRAT